MAIDPLVSTISGTLGWAGVGGSDFDAEYIGLAVATGQH